MPNQRAKNKVLVGAFVDAQLKSRVVRIAQTKGITTSDILSEALRLYLDRDRDAKTSSPGASPSSPAAPLAQQPEPDGKEEVWLL